MGKWVKSCGEVPNKKRNVWSWWHRPCQCQSRRPFLKDRKFNHNSCNYPSCGNSKVWDMWSSWIHHPRMSIIGWNPIRPSKVCPRGAILKYLQPAWRNHHNFSYKNNNTLFTASQPPSGFQKAAHAAPQAPKKSNIKIMMENFIASQTQQNKEFMNQNIHTNELVK